MALLALWHVTYDGGDHDLMYVFREPHAARVEVRAEDSSGAIVWPNYIEDRTRDGMLHAVTITPEPDWIYPVKIKIRSSDGDQAK